MAVSLRQGETLRVGDAEITYSSTDERGRVILHVECPQDMPVCMVNRIGRVRTFRVETTVIQHYAETR